VEKNIRGKQMWIWIRNTAFLLKKFADLRFADWDTKDVYGFAICGYSLQICGFAICGLAHLRNLLIFDCGMSP
jgi:hypothetical protein